jgi:hypothetical protein
VREGEEDLEVDFVGDAGGWRDARRGNRMERCVGSGAVESFGGILLERVFGRV